MILSATAVPFNVIDAGSAWQAIATIPDFAWELPFGTYLTAKGFKPSSRILDESRRAMGP